jgi:hypothetical protein
MTTTQRLTAVLAVVALLGCSSNADSQIGEGQLMSRIVYVDGMT